MKDGIDQVFTVSTEATEANVREAVESLRSGLVERGVAEQLCSTVEIAVVEALNNVAEHAYPDGRPGPVMIVAQIENSRLKFVIRDQGRAMPGLRLPSGVLPDLNVALEELPEGGFGWFILRRLTDSLEYDRKDNENCLSLVFAAK